MLATSIVNLLSEILKTSSSKFRQCVVYSGSGMAQRRYCNTQLTVIQYRGLHKAIENTDFHLYRDLWKLQYSDVAVVC